MNPLQKLMRLKQIETDLEGADPASLAVGRLEAERAAILRSVGTPPLHLIGSVDITAWSVAFAATFPNVDETDIYPWFANVMMAALDVGKADGLAESRAADKGRKEMTDTLELIYSGIQAGAIKAQMLATEGGVSKSLAIVVGEALQAGAAP